MPTLVYQNQCCYAISNAYFKHNKVGFYLFQCQKLTEHLQSFYKKVSDWLAKKLNLESITLYINFNFRFKI